MLDRRKEQLQLPPPPTAVLMKSQPVLEMNLVVIEIKRPNELAKRKNEIPAGDLAYARFNGAT